MWDQGLWKPGVGVEGKGSNRAGSSVRGWGGGPAEQGVGSCRGIRALCQSLWLRVLSLCLGIPAQAPASSGKHSGFCASAARVQPGVGWGAGVQGWWLSLPGLPTQDTNLKGGVGRCRCGRPQLAGVQLPAGLQAGTLYPESTASSVMTQGIVVTPRPISQAAFGFGSYCGASPFGYLVPLEMDLRSDLKSFNTLLFSLNRLDFYCLLCPI